MVQVVRVTLHRSPQLEGALAAPLHFGGIGEDVPVALRHGHEEVSARTVALTSSEDEVYLAQDLWTRLRLPDRDRLDLHLSWQPSERLVRLGPLVGIIADLKRKGNRPTGRQVPIFRQLLRAAGDLGVVAYVFSPFDVQWSKGTVKGSYLTGEDGWTTRLLPLPDVVYDQIVSRRFERRRDVRKTREKLIHLLYPRYFNAGFFDKWTVFHWLSSDDRTRHQLPPTILYRTPEQGLEFLEEHGDIYLKPSMGSLGVGLIRIHHGANGLVHYRWRKGNRRLEAGVCRDPAAWFTQHHRFFKQRSYLLQRTVPLWPFGNRIWDVRALLQKDGTRTWKRTKMFVRVSAPGDIASNVTTGGRAERVETLMDQLQVSRAQERAIVRRLSRTARLVAQVLEEKSGLLLGELGVDLGVDVHGRVWIIEVNAKPWKSPHTLAGTEELVRKSFLRPIAYAKSLAGFAP